MRERKLGLGGAWFWYGSGDQAQFVANWKTPGVGPVAVLWDGKAEAGSLRQFFAGAANTVIDVHASSASGPAKTKYETLLITAKDEIRLQSFTAPLVPQELAALLVFVRFDCTIGQSVGGEGTPLSVWGCLEEQQSNDIDTIGLYTTREALVALGPSIGQFAAQTSRSSLSSESVAQFLAEFEQGLREIIKNRSYTF